MAAAADFDAPRSTALEPEAVSLDLLQVRRGDRIDDLAETEFRGLPEADFVDEELTVPVVPVGADEFRCGSCFLVWNRNRFAGSRHGQDICRECA